MKHTILCVDDEQHNLDALYRTLRKEYAVVTALNGQDGLKLLEENDVTLIISDQRMPEMTGVEFLEKSLDINPDVQRIILTGFTEVDDLISAINTGRVYRYITKPWEPNDLKITIKQALNTLELTLENRRLFEDAIRLEKLATVGQVASGIAHEVKNQLSMLMGVELIQNQYPNDEFVKEMGDNILHARNRIVTILDEIKSFSKQSDTQLQISEIIVDEIIKTTKDIVELDPEVKGTVIDIQIEVSQLVKCDKDRILQVLINFIRNAAHAMEGKGTIHLTAASQDGMVSIAVRDSGCGIPQNIVEQIWQPFFTTKKEKGTGLGLSICKKIIEMHGGQVSCESKEGEGSTFSITLPAII